MSIDPLQRGLEQSFEAEKLSRFIRECDDIETLRETALSLLQQLGQMKVASSWMASRASESENAKLQMLAELIKQRSGGCKRSQTNERNGSIRLLALVVFWAPCLLRQRVGRQCRNLPFGRRPGNSFKLLERCRTVLGSSWKPWRLRS